MAYKQLKLWFNKDLAVMLSDKILSEDASFNKKSFVKAVDTQVDALELKDRVEMIADELHVHLGGNYKTGVATLMSVLGPENEEETGMFANFYWVMPIAKYIEKYGLDDYKLSIKAIEEITKRNTGEYTIRPYIERYPKKTMAVLQRWSKNKNKHVRRLSSEGPRPRLPWASKLDIFINDPSPLLPILDNLKDDSSKYVQKSVANCINDILKDNTEIAKSLIEAWMSAEPTKERMWIVKHALRNLIKKEDAWAIGILDA